MVIFIFYFNDEEEAKNNNFKEINSDFWVDLRFTDLQVWSCDCDKNCKKFEITQKNVDAEALLIFRDDNGNIGFVKYF